MVGGLREGRHEQHRSRDLGQPARLMLGGWARPGETAADSRESFFDTLLPLHLYVCPRTCLHLCFPRMSRVAVLLFHLHLKMLRDI